MITADGSILNDGNVLTIWTLENREDLFPYIPYLALLAHLSIDC